ncbi:MAG: Stp1/IreP family PP2C-type Ser/Thr phosphatase [Herpetosiphon sp.]
MSMIEYAGLSEQGPVRLRNEDYIAYLEPPEQELQLRKGSLFVVADGVGGSNAGDVASKEAALHMIQSYFRSNQSPQRALRDAIKRANLHVYDLGLSQTAYRRMETTLSALLLLGSYALITHVGDSRVYRVRDGVAEQLTDDHSEVGELVRMQLIDAEAARHHPRRNVITRSVGSDLMLQPDVRLEPLQADDVFVLCTDGLWEPVGADEISTIVQETSAAAACRNLVELALQRDTCDNVSVQIVRVSGWHAGAVSPVPANRGLLKRALRFLDKDGSS